jgi:spore coat polysaccharide biosynthesis protein SpsF
MILALLQARMSSTRLPGKVMMPILEKPMVLHQIDRIWGSALIDKLILATSDNSSDDDLANACVAYGVSVFRGSLDDVLDRFYQAALSEKADHIIRLTGDCPLADPQIIDRVIQHHLEGGFDYTSNVHPPTWPDGLDVEIFCAQKLTDAWQNAYEEFDREHATPWIHRQTDCFLGNLENSTDMSTLRWTVDEPEDLEFVRRIFAGLYPENQKFGMDDILKFIDKNPDTQAINQHFVRNANSGF